MKKLFETFGAVFFAIFFILLLAAGFFEISPAEAGARYAVVITVDGLRPDAISRSNSPNIQSLLMAGSYTLKARTVFPSKTLPAHTSLVTGLIPERHGMGFNSRIPILMEHTGAETVFGIAKKCGLESAMFVGKDKLEYIARPESVSRFESTNMTPTSVEDIVSRFSRYLATEKPDIVFIHFPEPDLTGHRDGWMSVGYIKAFQKVDRAVGAVLQSLRKAGTYDETLIIITSDHGGHATDHGTTSPADMTIPWIALGKGVKKGYKINKKVFIYDTAPTLLFALGIEPPQTWDGEPLREIFVTDPHKNSGRLQRCGLKGNRASTGSGNDE